MSHVVLVDQDDQPIGMEDKLRAHTLGSLHRAVSVFAHDAAGALIVQQRAADKYHSGGLWSNTACTHPREGESVIAAARRCLKEELGVVATLRPAFRFRYRSEVPPSLIEHEYDHVFSGFIHGQVKAAASEVAAWRTVSLDDITREVKAKPGLFTAWFRIALPLYVQWLERGGERLGNPFFEIPEA